MLTPDGARYWTMTEKRVARPFHLRWLQPFLCRQDERRWKALTWGSVAAVGILTAIYTNSPWMACVAFLPGVAFSVRHPVLVDAFGMALALGAALMLSVCWPIAIVLALLAGCTRETAPIWAAVYAWNPLLLVGLVPVGVRWLMRSGPDVLDPKNAWILQHPIKASIEFHAGRWTDPLLMVLPWGGLLAGITAFTTQTLVAVGLGYSQLLVATDAVRLYQWAAPVLALAAVAAVPAWALPIVALTVIFNPWKGPGI
jgi:hypothetical protein